MSRYDYEELKNKVLSENATAENINALGEWFEQYGDSFWNGKYYEIDSSHRLYPIYEETAEEEFNLVGYEIK